ncbi:hypothetical protein [Blastococcus sp. TF02A-26]|uniref:hypothetical protein n=1 Tax=Blastococcus sp. TF02A-26 TaxID=2250577 RepID=UPI000DEABE75|nr:hypothetical protein [Blastococcus sp. TF02A-26]RBY81842.1 hypothetical protein DQ240_20215 [Blastococcus sp. TF02A-26]
MSTPPDPTVRLNRPPPRPDHPDDHATVDLPRPSPAIRQPTIEFGTPEPVKVTVSARPRRERRFSTWPWIVGVLVALVVLAAVLVGMLLGGSTIDDPRLDGPDGEELPGIVQPVHVR